MFWIHQISHTPVGHWMDGNEFKVLSFSDSYAFTLYHNETAFQQTHFSNFVYVSHEACFNKAHTFFYIIKICQCVRTMHVKVHSWWVTDQCFILQNYSANVTVHLILNHESIAHFIQTIPSGVFLGYWM